jgi:hypothetical protein
VEKENHVLTMAVIDGLGHGPAAREAAAIAAGILQGSRHPLTGIIPEIHRQLMGTRGAVLSVVRYDMESGLIKYAGIGNITTYVINKGQVRILMSAEGFLGSRLPSFREYGLAAEEVEQIIMVSDGVGAIPGRDLLKISWQRAQDMAETIGQQWGLRRDDETVIVLKKKGS